MTHTLLARGVTVTTRACPQLPQVHVTVLSKRSRHSKHVLGKRKRCLALGSHLKETVTIQPRRTSLQSNSQVSCVGEHVHRKEKKMVKRGNVEILRRKEKKKPSRRNFKKKNFRKRKNFFKWWRRRRKKKSCTVRHEILQVRAKLVFLCHNDLVSWSYFLYFLYFYLLYSQ